MSFWDQPSPWYHYVVMIPAYFLFCFMFDALMRNKAGFGLVLGMISLFIVALNYTYFGAYPAGSYGVFLVIKAYSLVIPVITITSYRIFGPLPQNPFEDDPSNSNNCKDSSKVMHPKTSDNNTSAEIKKTVIKDDAHTVIDTEVIHDKITLPRCAITEMQFENTIDKTDKRREKWRQCYPDCLKKFFIEQYKKPQALTMMGYFFWGVFLINMSEALLFEISMGNDFDEKLRLFDYSNLWFYDYLGYFRYFNVIAGIITTITAPIAKYPNEYDTRFWFLDRNGDFLMYLPENKQDKKIGFIWILLYTTWDFEFLIRFSGSGGVLFGMIHLIVPVIQSTCRFHYGLYLQSRMYVLWTYAVWLFILRNCIFNTTNINSNVIGDGLILGVLSIFNFILAIGYCYAWFHYLKKLKIRLLTKV